MSYDSESSEHESDTQRERYAKLLSKRSKEIKIQAEIEENFKQKEMKNLELPTKSKSKKATIDGTKNNVGFETTTKRKRDHIFSMETGTNQKSNRRSSSNSSLFNEASIDMNKRITNGTSKTNRHFKNSDISTENTGSKRKLESSVKLEESSETSSGSDENEPFSQAVKKRLSKSTPVKKSDLPQLIKKIYKIIEHTTIIKRGGRQSSSSKRNALKSKIVDFFFQLMNQLTEDEEQSSTPKSSSSATVNDTIECISDLSTLLNQLEMSIAPTVTTSTTSTSGTADETTTAAEISSVSVIDTTTINNSTSTVAVLSDMTNAANAADSGNSIGNSNNSNSKSHKNETQKANMIVKDSNSNSISSSSKQKWSDGEDEEEEEEDEEVLPALEPAVKPTPLPKTSLTLDQQVEKHPVSHDKQIEVADQSVIESQQPSTKRSKLNPSVPAAASVVESKTINETIQIPASSDNLVPENCNKMLWLFGTVKPVTSRDQRKSDGATTSATTDAVATTSTTTASTITSTTTNTSTSVNATKTKQTLTSPNSVTYLGSHYQIDTPAGKLASQLLNMHKGTVAKEHSVIRSLLSAVGWSWRNFSDPNCSHGIYFTPWFTRSNSFVSVAEIDGKKYYTVNELTAGTAVGADGTTDGAVLGVDYFLSTTTAFNYVLARGFDQRRTIDISVATADAVSSAHSTTKQSAANTESGNITIDTAVEKSVPPVKSTSLVGMKRSHALALLQQELNTATDDENAASTGNAEKTVIKAMNTTDDGSIKTNVATTGTATTAKTLVSSAWKEKMLLAKQQNSNIARSGPSTSATAKTSENVVTTEPKLTTDEKLQLKRQQLEMKRKLETSSAATTAGGNSGSVESTVSVMDSTSNTASKADSARTTNSKPFVPVSVPITPSFAHNSTKSLFSPDNSANNTAVNSTNNSGTSSGGKSVAGTTGNTQHQLQLVPSPSDITTTSDQQQPKSVIRCVDVTKLLRRASSATSVSSENAATATATTAAGQNNNVALNTVPNTVPSSSTNGSNTSAIDRIATTAGNTKNTSNITVKNENMNKTVSAPQLQRAVSSSSSSKLSSKHSDFGDSNSVADSATGSTGDTGGGRGNIAWADMTKEEKDKVRREKEREKARKMMEREKPIKYKMEKIPGLTTTSSKNNNSGSNSSTSNSSSNINGTGKVYVMKPSTQQRTTLPLPTSFPSPQSDATSSAFSAQSHSSTKQSK